VRLGTKGINLLSAPALSTIEWPHVRFLEINDHARTSGMVMNHICNASNHIEDISIELDESIEYQRSDLQSMIEIVPRLKRLSSWKIGGVSCADMTTKEDCNRWSDLIEQFIIGITRDIEVESAASFQLEELEKCHEEAKLAIKNGMIIDMKMINAVYPSIEFPKVTILLLL
jgi:hypothetical protein